MYSTVQYSTAANVSLYLKVLYPAKNIYLNLLLSLPYNTLKNQTYLFGHPRCKTSICLPKNPEPRCDRVQLIISS